MHVKGFARTIGDGVLVIAQRTCVDDGARAGGGEGEKGGRTRAAIINIHHTLRDGRLVLPHSTRHVSTGLGFPRALTRHSADAAHTNHAILFQHMATTAQLNTHALLCLADRALPTAAAGVQPSSAAVEGEPLASSAQTGAQSWSPAQRHRSHATGYRSAGTQTAGSGSPRPCAKASHSRAISATRRALLLCCSRAICSCSVASAVR
eukprot:1621945-Rhodomonas_salina.4